MKKYALIVAGGSGERMGNATPKQFLLLHGKPVLYYTLRTFLHAYTDMEIVLVLPAQHIAKGEELIESLQAKHRIVVTAGGKTRFHSVQNGLSLIATTPSVIFVHDGVRCVISKNLIERCYEQAVEKGSAIPAVAATDSVRINDGSTHHVIDRNNVKIIQTPQTFQSHILLTAFRQHYKLSFTDEATVAEAAGYNVFLIEGEHNNIKVTRPIDLLIAEKLLQEEKAV